MGEVLPIHADDDARPVRLPSFGLARRIQKVVALSYGVDVRDMTSPATRRSAAWPRQTAMYLVRELTGKSFPCIGRLFGNRHHTTVISAVKAVEARIAKNPFDRADVEALRESLIP